eukprot:CAMPEP_0119128348 /NCGR_PEP_ID=MMETSP1310-20130426/6541_1 /TAXON_ID=464262 /ORGANISM="Genus nov. species nov., Strain RCC2339" /LENGTH=1027 /DNA_ID=CAMNT_0007118683 /DNA_START=137 /DNA_END=3220 /DNA_ORIENTATION=-
MDGHDKEGWLVVREGRSMRRLTVQTRRLWCQLDGISEFLSFYSDNPNVYWNARLLFSLSVEKYEFSRVVKKAKGVYKEGEGEGMVPAIRVTATRGRKLTLYPNDASDTGAADREVGAWLASLIVTKQNARDGFEVLQQWKNDPECRACVDGFACALDYDGGESEEEEYGGSTDDTHGVGCSEWSSDGVTSGISPRCGLSGGERSRDDVGGAPLENSGSSHSALTRSRQSAADSAQKSYQMLLKNVVELPDGTRHRLGAIVAGQDVPTPTVLILLRHFGCVLCRALVHWWVKAYDIVNKLGASVIAVGNGDPQSAQEFVRDTGFQGALLLDRNRNLYKQLNCRRGLKYALAPQTMGLAKEVLGDGHAQGKTAGDVLQLGGAFLLCKRKGVIFQHQEAFAGESLQRLGDLLRALKLYLYYEPKETFPWSPCVPTWSSMRSREVVTLSEFDQPLVVSTCADTEDAERPHFALECGVINPVDTSSTSPDHTSFAYEGLSYFLSKDSATKTSNGRNGWNESDAQQAEAKRIPLMRKGSQLLRKSITSLVSATTSRTDRRKARELRRERKDWRESIDAILESVNFSFTSSVRLQQSQVTPYFARHFSSSDHQQEELMRSTFLFLCPASASSSKSNSSPVAEEDGSDGIIAARICSNGILKVMVITKNGAQRGLLPFDAVKSDLMASAQEHDIYVTPLARAMYRSRNCYDTKSLVRSITNTVGEKIALRSARQQVEDGILEALRTSGFVPHNLVLQAVAVSPGPDFLKTIELIVDMETRCLVERKTMKFGLLYRKQWQDETEMYLNSIEDMSPQFKDFLGIMGQMRKASECEYSGGLDNSGNDKHGPEILCAQVEDVSVVFHVAPLIPKGEEDSVARKRHVGNDVGVVIFEDGSPSAADDSGGVRIPFDPAIIRSKYNQVFIVVRPLDPPDEVSEGESASNPNREWEIENMGEGATAGSEQRYVVHVVSRQWVPPVGPAVRPYPYYTAASLRKFLLAKLINSERAALQAVPTFAGQRRRVRASLLRELMDAVGL